MGATWFLVVSLSRQASPALHLHFVPVDELSTALLLSAHFALTDDVALQAAASCVNLYGTGSADVSEWPVDTSILSVSRVSGPLRRCPPLNAWESGKPQAFNAGRMGLCSAVRVALAHAPVTVRLAYAPRLAQALEAPMPVERRVLPGGVALSVWAVADGDQHAFCWH